MIKTRVKKYYPLIIFLVLLNLGFTKKTTAPDLMHSKVFQENTINVFDYFISEKLDGVRAHWDGKQLISRKGKIFAAPDWFIKSFSAQALDGELWIARNNYERVVSIVNRKKPHQGWDEIKFWIFDLPKDGGTFSERLEKMKKIVKQSSSPYLKIINQFQVADEIELKKQLQTFIDGGAEGLMLHKKTALYTKGKSNDLLKFKQYQDAEAVVIGYKKGKGKYTNLVGSLQVKIKSGLIFYIGSGLSDELRKNPPPLQSTITFQHQGFTKNGIPRFAVFLRIRTHE